MRLGADDQDLAEEVLAAYDAFNEHIEPPSRRVRILSLLVSAAAVGVGVALVGFTAHALWRLFLFGWDLQ